ncbi:hypothetical protein V6N11_032425 [Hibiscus sabdariffa]|uniref:non-specific serine/threonine protein kinase n=1 Tax=Hibiscus sabdariffa TaxID=183260 RepID=A0ABR2T1D8_9ROSI
MKKSVHEFLFSPTMHLKNGKTVRALNSIFQQWQIQAGDSWNMSGEPCSGVALSPRDSVFEDPANNPAIRCDCSFRNNTLCHITGLKIERNFFSGPLPAFLGNMSRLKSLSFSHNRLSGPIPKELGNLKELHTPSIDDNSFSGPIPTELAKLNMLHKLSLDNNNFSGTLPPELGTLANLEQLYSNSCGFSGEIPSTFANLERLRIVWASDNAFTGKIPDFVGNNWTKLRKLRFQGNSFEGPIPSSFAKLTSLASLRIGDIYNGSSSLDFVRDLKNLTELVLRNVLLTGTLPSYITELNSLEKLDLSFNNLTGTIPSYMFRMNSLKHLFLGNNSLTGAVPNVQTTTLKTIDLSYNLLSGDLPSWVDTIRQLNLVGNNFTPNSSNIGLFPGLECLQRSFPCNRDAPRYAQFAINCGGQQIISDGIVFEGDDRPLGTATYVVPNAQKLAVSNVGLFEYTENYLQNTSAQVRGTDTPELYNSSRISPGSLRYYGLGLENGTYTVNLFFAEIGSLDRTSRRVFDVYIQGTRRLRDFDISKEADGVLRAATRNFTVNITENHLEIHLFWAAIRPKENRTTLIAGVTVAVMVMLLILVFAFFYKKRIGEYEEEEDGRVVAVKQLSTASNHGKSQFIAEVSTISAVQHRNLVKLLGYCIKDKRHLLVYEYLENKSLDQALFELCPKISDFGLAKRYDDNKTHITSGAAGTFGRPKTVNTLEDDKSYILDWAWDLHENNQSLELVDPTLAEFDENEALRVVRVALLCTQGSSSMRPPMSRVVAMLAGDIDVSSDITRPSYFIDWNFRDSTGTTHDPGEAPALSSGNVNVSEFSDITEGR